jgi:prevent-host-death family protein
MGTVTAKQLNQKTGEVLRRVRSGERMTVTYRGKPIAVIAPSESEITDTFSDLSPFEEAWRDIEQTLEKAMSQFSRLQEVTK